MTTYQVPLSPAQSSIIDDDDDDESHNCRRCDLPISEGHAYELGGDRWHMYCFSCSKCSKLLGTSSNFLVLGTGDLICSECSYACNACGKKIDDLAILTGDQAYCSSCFCCRNCKKRIEDLRYARTSKGLFCMSCHEKLLEKKRRHDSEKRFRSSRYASKLPNNDKSLPKVPPTVEPEQDSHQQEPQPQPQQQQQQHLIQPVPSNPERVLSPAETTSSYLSTPENTEFGAGTAATMMSDIPPRSPNRVPVTLAADNTVTMSPEEETNGMLDDPQRALLDPPISVSPMKLPFNNDLNNSDYQNAEENIQTHLTPQNKNFSTPETTQQLSPLRQGMTPSERKRQAVVVESISSSSSNNILSNYLKDSPPPKVPPPQLPTHDEPLHTSSDRITNEEDDFMDMNDSDEDFKYHDYPTGFNQSRNSEAAPTGLNIQGLPSFDEQFDAERPGTRNTYDREPIYQRDEINSTPNHNEDNLNPPSSAKSWRNVLMSPGSPSPNKSRSQGPPQSASSYQSNNSEGVSRSKSIRSPKSFLNFRKHKKSQSQTSVEGYKISSPIMEQRGTFESMDNTLSTPKLAHPETSPYQGAALFTTPPVESHNHQYLTNSGARKASIHARSRSDANGIVDIDLSQHELELRGLKTEIRDLKLTKHGIMKDINGLNVSKDELKLEILQLQSQLDSMKMEMNNHIKSQSASNEALPSAPVSAPASTPSQSQSQSLQQVQHQQENQPVIRRSIDHPAENAIIHTAEQVDTKQKTTKPRFWKRGNFFTSKNDGMATSQSSYYLNQVLNNGNGNSNTANNNHNDKGSNNVQTNGKSQISAPMLRTEEADELGGNDNKKLMNGKNYLEISSFSSSSNTSSNNNSNPALIMSDLFNSTLEMRAQFEKRPIPIIVQRLVSEVERRGLGSEGIYRKNGATSQMNSILKAFNNLYQNETSNELEGCLNSCDVNAITSSLKRYLYHHLPEPIITINIYEQYIGVSKLGSDEERLSQLTNIIEQLPKTNIKTLKFMLNHLARVEARQLENKMNYHNLAVVFAPTFIRINDGERELMDMQSRNFVTEFLLINQDEVFGRIEV